MDTNPPETPAQAGPQPGTETVGGAEGKALWSQLRQGNLNGLREYMARTRAGGQWNDRAYMLRLVVEAIRQPVLDFACDVEPEAADLFVIRTAFFADLAWTMRGSGTVDKVGAQRFNSAADCVRAMLQALEKAEQLDAQDPTALVVALPAMTIFTALVERQSQAFQKVTELAPDLPLAYHAITNRLAERWGGSHEESLEFARRAMSKAGPNSAMLGCLFYAHLMVQSHLSGFDKDQKAADAYLQKADVREELNAVFDRCTAPPYTPERSGIELVHHAATWYFQVRDAKRFARALELTGNLYRSVPWKKPGPGADWYQQEILKSVGQTLAAARVQTPFDECVTFTAHALDMLNAGKGKEMDRALNAALVLARMSKKEQSEQLVPLAVLGFSVMRKAEQRPEESRKLREQAATMLDAQTEIPESGEYTRVMAILLKKLDDHRRAIPYWEKAIELRAETADALQIGDMLSDLGACYSAMGMRDHAVIPLRAAVKSFRAYPKDPRLTAVLINLGNALRKSAPGEAEAVYKEAADLYVAQLQYMSATAAWVNLGVLYSEQGRQAEALEYYQKALRVREQTKGTKPVAIARIHNNIANVYRRMGRYADGHAAVDRSMKLGAGDMAMAASAYGTKGQLYFYAGEDKRAVEWLRKSHAEKKKLASSNLDDLTENLEMEAKALERMGKLKDAAQTRESLEVVRAKMRAMPQANVSAGEGKAPLEGAVLVELGFGSTLISTTGPRDTRRLAERLHRAARAQDVGSYSGSLALPENTTLIFYGKDAEALFAAMEPALFSEQECEGAKVMIRQGVAVREVTVSVAAAVLN